MAFRNILRPGRCGAMLTRFLTSIQLANPALYYTFFFFS